MWVIVGRLLIILENEGLLYYLKFAKTWISRRTGMGPSLIKPRDSNSPQSWKKQPPCFSPPWTLNFSTYWILSTNIVFFSITAPVSLWRTSYLITGLLTKYFINAMNSALGDVFSNSCMTWPFYCDHKFNFWAAVAKSSWLFLRVSRRDSSLAYTPVWLRVSEIRRIWQFSRIPISCLRFA